jgi:CRP/FNR family cyclic AMP-dependent transcriptional regulator
MTSEAHQAPPGADAPRPSPGAASRIDVTDDRVPAALLEAMARRGGVRSFPAQAILINEGDTTESLYILLHGRVRVYAAGDNGREVVLSELGPGDYFGELSLDGEARSVSVRTLEPTTCCVVQGADLREFLAEHPDFALHLTFKLIRMVRRLTQQVKSLALQDVYGRVVRVLMELSDAAPDAPEQRVLRVRLTQQDIADRVGSSREMVNRIMKELTIGGYVAQREDKLLVLMKKLPAAW